MDTAIAASHRDAGAASVRRVLVAKGLRSFADGFVSLLLPVYLLALGYSPLDIGIIATATLVGSGIATLAIGFVAHRFAHRVLLLAASALMVATGLAFASATAFWPLVVVAFVGTLNPSSGDVSVFVPLEHAMLSHAIGDERRTATFARYSVAGTLAAALGSLAAAVPTWLGAHAGISVASSIRWMFVAYALIGGGAALAYSGLPRAAESIGKRTTSALGKSKRIVYTLAALFAVDAFGGGLVVQSMIALWLYQRFDLSLATAGSLFFWLGVVTSISYLVAARVSRRIGLVNTMVFTHLPANVCLVAIAFVPDLGVRDRAPRRAGRAVADGRADAHVVRDGDRRAGGASGSRQRHLRAAQPRVRRRSMARRLPADGVGVRLAASRGRRGEDRLRRDAARALRQRSATGGAPPLTRNAAARVGVVRRQPV